MIEKLEDITEDLEEIEFSDTLNTEEREIENGIIVETEMKDFEENVTNGLNENERNLEKNVAEATEEQTEVVVEVKKVKKEKKEKRKDPKKGRVKKQKGLTEEKKKEMKKVIIESKTE